MKNLGSVLLFTVVEDTLVNGVGGQGQNHTDYANRNAGDHGVRQPQSGTHIGHHQAHAGAHGNGADGTIDIAKDVGGTLDLGVQSFQFIQLIGCGSSVTEIPDRCCLC